MQNLAGENDKVIDLTQDIDEEEPTCQGPCHKQFVLDSAYDSDDDNSGIKQESSESNPQREGPPIAIQSPSMRCLRRVDNTLDKAVTDIRKGGSLMMVSLQYGIPEDVIYEKLVSRSLPKVIDILTRTEEKKLVKWILQSNINNNLVFKYQLMERVGRLKKVLNITPIFAKSKYGRMWYDYFLKAYPEIFENDGLLMPSANDEDYWLNEKDKMTMQEIKTEPTTVKADPTELLLSFGIKDAVVVLQDCIKHIKSSINLNEEENVPLQLREGKSYTESNNSNSPGTSAEIRVHCEEENIPLQLREGKLYTQNSNSPGTSAEIRDHCEEVCIRKQISDVISSNPNTDKNSTKNNNLRHNFKKCNRTFCNKYKHKRHLMVHTPKELYTITCYKCFKRYPSTYHLNIHLETTHSKLHVECNDCGKVFKHQKSLMSHRRNIHSSLHIESNPPSFICDLCGKCFKYKNSLEAHIIYGHLNEKKKYVCDVCKKDFIKYSGLIRHKFRHTKTSPLKCRHCDKTFFRKYLMREHLKSCFKNENKKLSMECDQISKEYCRQIRDDLD